MTVESGRVIVDGLTPGKQALVFSVGRKAMTHYAYLAQVATVLDDLDRDGRVELEADTPLRSVWIVVDMQTAQYVVGTPDGFEVQFSEFVRGFSRREGVLDQVTATALGAAILYVHPGGGAWKFHAVDGRQGDQDGMSNGEVIASLGAGAEVIAAGNSRRELVPGGLLFVIAPDSLAVSVERLTPQRLEAVRP